MSTQCGRWGGLGSFLVVGALAQTGLAGVAGDFHADQPFPQYRQLWSERWSADQWSASPASGEAALGGYLEISVHNATGQVQTLDAVALNGVQLSQALVFAEKSVAGHLPASIGFSKLPQAAKDTLTAAGDPVWYRVDPAQVPAGGTAQITIRLRRRPVEPRVTVTAQLGGEAVTAAVDTKAVPPRFAGISVGRSLSELWLYVRAGDAPNHGPRAIRIDGRDVTRAAVVQTDPALSTTLVRVRLSQPIAPGSLHTFEADCGAGGVARAAVRLWKDEFRYGMWGYSKQGDTPLERAKIFLEEMRKHHINTLMQSYGGEVADFMKSPAGRKWCKEVGMKAMLNHPGAIPDPAYLFIMDEPDAHDYAANALPPERRLGVLAMDLIRRTHDLRQDDPQTPQLLNVDNTFKPENWYTYARLGDILSADPYYQEQQKIVWNERPTWAGAFTKPTYVLAVSEICESAGAPRPLHIILNSVRHDIKDQPFRFATPVEKQIEAFYAVGGGAKSLSYWWYTPYGEFHGCGGSSPEAVALWTQIGLIGAQLRAVGPLIVQSCPVSLPVKAPSRLWIRTLASGDEALLMLMVNENIASDRQGTVVAPLERATVTFAPPAWLTASDVFEVRDSGVVDVAWKRQGEQLVLDFGRTDVSRLVVVAAKPLCRQEISRLLKGFSATVSVLHTATRPAGGHP